MSRFRMNRILADSMTLLGQGWTPRRCLKPLGTNVPTPMIGKWMETGADTKFKVKHTKVLSNIHFHTPFILLLLTNDCFYLFPFLSQHPSLLSLLFIFYSISSLRQVFMFILFFQSVFIFALPPVQNRKSYLLLLDFLTVSTLILSFLLYFFSPLPPPPPPLIISPFLLLSVINRHWF